MSLNTCVCRPICAASSVSSRALSFLPLLSPRIYAVIGDVNVKVWCSWHDVNCQVRRIDRAHDYRTCKESFTLRHDRKILVLTANANTGIMLDMEMMTQITVRTRKTRGGRMVGHGLGAAGWSDIQTLLLICTFCLLQFQLPVPSSSIPLYFNGTHLLMLHQGANGTRLVQVYDAVAQRLVKTLLLDKADKFYCTRHWNNRGHRTLNEPDALLTCVLSSCSAPGGFQLLTRSPPSTASSSVVPPAAVDTTTTAASSSVVESKSNGLAAAAHAANTTYLSYISRHNVIKCVPLNAFPSGIPASVLEQQGAPTDRPSTRQLVTDRIITGGSNVRIIAYIYDEVDNTFITLNSDAKVKVFGLAAGADAAAAAEAAAAATHTSPETTPFPGVLLHKYRNVAGTFKIGYPYVMKKIGARLLFYTADEGIFVIRLDDK